jgi:N-acetylmuramoyl-L-alanine amidase
VNLNCSWIYKKLNIAFSGLFVIVLVLVPISTIGSDIDSLRVWRSPEKTRLVIDLSGQVKHQLITLQNPDRLVIDISDAKFKANIKSLDLSKTSILTVRHAVRNSNDLRVVLDLKGSVSPKSFALEANEKSGDRLVVDLYDKKQKVSKTVAKMLKRNDRKIVIAIDAGHGGEDPGASGPNRLREKRVVLQIAQKLEKLFDQNPYFEGVLVRTGDYYVGLRKRTRIAREKKADFFISIHADGFDDPRAYGASVYALSTKGATSEAARYLASSANRADLIGGASALSLDDKDDVLAGVLLDLSMNETLRSSLDAGRYVLRNMGTVARLHKKKVEQAGFLVLKSPDIPSLLIETGFISNPKEAKQLSSAIYQQKMAQAVYDGLFSFYMERPPVGTLLAKSSKELIKTYVIARGDTLSEIAQRHKTSVSKILRYNNLSSSSIRVGQKISIPPS